MLLVAPGMANMLMLSSFFSLLLSSGYSQLMVRGPILGVWASADLFGVSSSSTAASRIRPSTTSGTLRKGASSSLLCSCHISHDALLTIDNKSSNDILPPLQLKCSSPLPPPNSQACSTSPLTESCLLHTTTQFTSSQSAQLQSRPVLRTHSCSSNLGGHAPESRTPRCTS